VALKMVWDVARAVKVPVLGMGGICTASDAIQFFLAGATAVAIGSMSFRQPDAAAQIIAGITAYLERHALGGIEELIGAVRV